MPVIIFNDNNIIVVFDNTFVADQHEAWFDLSLWTRVSVDREHPTLYKYDRRGESFFAKFKDASIPTFITKEL